MMLRFVYKCDRCQQGIDTSTGRHMNLYDHASQIEKAALTVGRVFFACSYVLIYDPDDC